MNEEDSSLPMTFDASTLENISSSDCSNQPDDDIDDPSYIPDGDSDSNESESNSFFGISNASNVSNPQANSIALVPYSDSETGEDDNMNNCQKTKSRKRVKCEQNWKKNVRKNKRVSGKQYTNS